jgi:predicted peptidase
MIRRVLPLCLVLVPLLQSTAQDAPKTGFLDRVFKEGDKEIKYVLFVPQGYNPEKEYPLILFLHGSGESGTDGKKQAAVGLGKAVKERAKTFPAIVVFPQSQKGGWGAGSAEGKRALAIVEAVSKDYKVDSKRLYLTGLSMGGFGSWSFVAAQPEKWAAVVPVCGGGDPKTAAKFKDVPLWAFHGDKDTAVPVSRTRDMIDALKKAGGEPKYTEYPDVGHNSWDKAYATEELYEWLFKQARK